ncbi:MAG TPA: hypothetical protein VNG33_03660 [Polyangiaceae bacterium]|nr:hypothetical protein [Polyangiaceae bacterium]
MIIVTLDLCPSRGGVQPFADNSHVLDKIAAALHGGDPTRQVLETNGARF